MRYGGVVRGGVVVLVAAGLTAQGAEGKLSITFADESEGDAGKASVVVVGTVFEDTNSDGRFTPGVDVPLGGVGVSDGEQVTLSDPAGRYQLAGSGGCGVVFATQPPGFARRKDFFALLPEATASAAPLRPGAAPLKPLRFGVDFPLTRAAAPEPGELTFVHVADTAIAGETDRKALAQAVGEVEALNPRPAFAVLTGHVVDEQAQPEAWTVLAGETSASRLPWYPVPSRASLDSATTAALAAPPWFSADIGKLHLVFLGSSGAGQEMRKAWLERDIRLVARGKQVLAFCDLPPDPELTAALKKLNVLSVFHGGTYDNRMEGLKNGMALVGQSPLLMAGLDASPPAIRIVRIGAGGEVNSEFRVRNTRKYLRFPYPGGELSGQERIMATIYDSVGEVAEARFRLATPGGVLAEGSLKKVSPFTWMAPLEPQEYGLKKLPEEFVVAVRARGTGNETWENGRRVVVPQRRRDRPDAVKTGNAWPQFMGNAQRTGVSEDRLLPPLRMVWATPSHGSIDLSSPVFFDHYLAIGVRDRDNLINNGVAVLDPESGEMKHFVKSRSPVIGTPCFAQDKENQAAKIYATAAGGEVLMVNPDSGEVEGRGTWGERSPWILGSPGVQKSLTLAGGAGGLMGLLTQNGERRWISSFGGEGMSSYASPTFAGPLVVLGANGLQTQGRPTGIYAVEALTGKLRWFNGSPGLSGSVAAPRPGVGFALERTGFLKVLNPESGQDAGGVNLGSSWSLSTPAVDDEVLVVASGDGKVHGLTTATLERMWTFEAKPGLWPLAPFDREGKAVFSSPTISGETVYIGCSDGHLYALNKMTGQAVWSYDLGVPTLSTPCVTGNSLFTAAWDGNIYAFTGEREKKK